MILYAEACEDFPKNKTCSLRPSGCALRISKIAVISLVSASFYFMKILHEAIVERRQGLERVEAYMLKELFDIYFTSLKVGAMTFGGGYAMLPILQKEVVEKKAWNTEEEILDYYALAQCLPGIIMVNTLGFVGQKRKGTIGAIVSGLGAITPPLIIITIIAALLTAFADVAAVQNAFAGIRVCVCVLIFNSILKLWKSSMVDKKCLAIFLIVAVGSYFIDISPILFVVGSGILGILIQIAGRRKVK